jgi:hypothetical protein
MYNKPNGCSATGALAPGSDHHQQQQKARKIRKKVEFVNKIRSPEAVERRVSDKRGTSVDFGVF